MADFSKHKIKQHPSITSIFVRFLITAKISEPLQDISQMKIDIKVLINKLDRHHGRLTNIKDRGKPGGRLLGESSELARPSVNLVI